MPERMMEAGQANAAQNHAGGAPLVGAAGGTGQGKAGTANAVSMGSHEKTHVKALARVSEGIIEGAKNNIAAINIVVTILRKFMVVPPLPFPRLFPGDEPSTS
jgi:hypothetical protein